MVAEHFEQRVQDWRARLLPVERTARQRAQDVASMEETSPDAMQNSAKKNSTATSSMQNATDENEDGISRLAATTEDVHKRCVQTESNWGTILAPCLAEREIHVAQCMACIAQLKQRAHQGAQQFGIHTERQLDSPGLSAAPRHFLRFVTRYQVQTNNLRFNVHAMDLVNATPRPRPSGNPDSCTSVEGTRPGYLPGRWAQDNPWRIC